MLLKEYITYSSVKYIKWLNSGKTPHINLKDFKIFLHFQVQYILQRRRHIRMQTAITVLMPNSRKQENHFSCIMKMITQLHILQSQFISTYISLESLIFISTAKAENIIIKWTFLNLKDCRVYLKDLQMMGRPAQDLAFQDSREK